MTYQYIRRRKHNISGVTNPFNTEFELLGDTYYPKMPNEITFGTHIRRRHWKVLKYYPELRCIDIEDLPISKESPVGTVLHGLSLSDWIFPDGREVPKEFYERFK